MSEPGASLVVGTAGHIDHGKTSLVRALTGVDLDSLPEEKDRGITIALGFAPLVLADGRRIAFVDVPGHERLVRTMVAGATGVDAVLLCISAVDGVMPQTREHLAILRLLGVHEGAVVLTMADLVDPELLELAVEDVRDLVRGTFLADRPVVPFSSVTGEGREALLEVLGALHRDERPADGPFRLPVDRSFVRSGFGTVVTGTAWSGTIRDGDAVRLLPEGVETRVRGIQVHGASTSEARAGWRVALNLAGIERADAHRGSVVVAGAVPSASIVDVRYHHLPDAPPLDDGSPVRLLHGTAERLGRLYLAEDADVVAPGASAWVQIRLEAPLPCLPGDRFVLRRPSPQVTLGGGEIVDPWAPKLRRKDRARWPAQLDRLKKGDPLVWLERAGEAGLTPTEWAERLDAAPRATPPRTGSGSPPEAVAPAVPPASRDSRERATAPRTGSGSPAEASAPAMPSASRDSREREMGSVLGDRVLSPRVVARLEGALLEAIERFHRESPLTLGANRRELRRERLGHLSERAFDALVDRLCAVGALHVEGPLLRSGSFAVALDPGQRALRERILATVAAAGLDGVSVKALHEKHPEPETSAIAHLLDSAGDLRQVPGLGWAATEALEDLERRIGGWFATHADLTPGDFKELTGLSRKAAIPLLEWLDKSRFTKRVGDVRVKGPALP